MADPQLAEPVLKHAKSYFPKDQPGQDFNRYLKNLVDPNNSKALPLEEDGSHDISQYYISSSHNTYLTGNQLWSKSSVETYKDVLERGCRCIEIDVWNGGTGTPSSPDGSENDPPLSTSPGHNELKRLTGLMKRGFKGLQRNSVDKSDKDETEQVPKVDDGPRPPTEDAPITPWRTNSSRDEPRVLHGHTATKQILFRDVCEVVQQYAFCASDSPLIVSLEVHTSHEQQEVMVDLMNEYWHQFLLPLPPDFSDDTPLPPLNDLKRKILIKVKYSAPEKVTPGNGISRSRALSHADPDSSEDEDDQVHRKKGKISESLSRLGIYTRSCHFSNLDQPEAKIPTHVFALSEGKLLSLQEQHRDGIFQHNLKYLMRAYPKGTRVRSSNLDPGPFWAQGIQMVALNWQQMNAAMMLNEAMFEGTSGWVLKPEGYRMSEDRSILQIRRGRLNLSVRLLAAQNLNTGNKSTPNAYIKSELHTERQIPQGGKKREGKQKQRSATKHSCDPDFNEDVNFHGIEDVVLELSFLRIKVMDDVPYAKDKCLGWLCFRLDRLPSGLRFLPLRDNNAKFNGSALLLHTDIGFEAVPQRTTSTGT